MIPSHLLTNLQTAGRNTSVRQLQMFGCHFENNVSTVYTIGYFDFPEGSRLVEVSPRKNYRDLLKEHYPECSYFCPPGTYQEKPMVFDWNIPAQKTAYDNFVTYCNGEHIFS